MTRAVSAGFDAAKGDDLGECEVTPAGYAHMTHMLSGLAGGKLLVALEVKSVYSHAGLLQTQHVRRTGWLLPGRHFNLSDRRRKGASGRSTARAAAYDSFRYCD